MTATVLICDDEKNIRRTLAMVLAGEGYGTIEVGSGEEALSTIREESVDLAILDVRLPGISGIETLAKLRETATERPHLPVLMVSGHASVAEAVQAVQLGATDFFEKPLDRDRVLLTVRNALRTSQLEDELDRLRADVERRYDIIGRSPAVRAIFAQLEKIAPSKGRVLITGESGTGKELLARAVHRLSQRANKEFIKVNCAAIPAELIESELFGYERGAFTGAHGRRRGLFEQADGGTLFLDEIGDMSAGAQAKVLRALQSGEISRVGAERSIAVDARVIAATNKDLELEVRERRFREDLYFRLNVLPIHCPPLRERREDIPELTRAFVHEFCETNGVAVKVIEAEVYDALAERDWPGNIRELRNAVERMVILSGSVITMVDLPPETSIAATHTGAPSQNQNAASSHSGSDRLPLREFRMQVERDYIVQALDDVQWNISRAADLLGVERTNLHKKIKTYNIQREDS